MSADNKNQAERVLVLVQVIARYAASGATNSELATTAQSSRPNVTRDMALLIKAGFATKDEETGRFYPSTTFTRLTFAVDADFNRVQTQLADRRRSATGI